MRTLKFIVNGQIIEKNNNCDFGNLVKGTKGYLVAQFSFSEEWSGCAKVVGFYSNYGEEYEPRVLDAHNSCMIPDEVLEKESFLIKLIGKRENFQITTNKFKIVQDGGK